VEELAALVEQLRVANAGLREVIAGQAMQEIAYVWADTVALL